MKHDFFYKLEIIILSTSQQCHSTEQVKIMTALVIKNCCNISASFVWQQQ